MTAEEIIKQLEDVVQKKLPMSPSFWVEQAQKLVVLMGDEADKLYTLQKQVAQEKVKWIEQGKSVSEAKLRVEASDLYEQMLKQKAFLERINEIIRIAKIQSKMRESEYFAQNL